MGMGVGWWAGEVPSAGVGRPPDYKQPLLQASNVRGPDKVGQRRRCWQWPFMVVGVTLGSAGPAAFQVREAAFPFVHIAELTGQLRGSDVRRRRTVATETRTESAGARLASLPRAACRPHRTDWFERLKLPCSRTRSSVSEPYRMSLKLRRILINECSLPASGAGRHAATLPA
jgi:hypothetical protein